jgi:hypothetical protein
MITITFDDAVNLGNHQVLQNSFLAGNFSVHNFFLLFLDESTLSNNRIEHVRTKFD